MNYLTHYSILPLIIFHKIKFIIFPTVKFSAATMVQNPAEVHLVLKWELSNLNWELFTRLRIFHFKFKLRIFFQLNFFNELSSDEFTWIQ